MAEEKASYQWRKDFVRWLRDRKQVPYEIFVDHEGNESYLFFTRTGYIDLLLEYGEENPYLANEKARRAKLKVEWDVVNGFLKWLFDAKDVKSIVCGTRGVVKTRVIATKDTAEHILGEYFNSKGKNDG